MRSLDDQAMKDPDGFSLTLVSSPAANAYSYNVIASGGGVAEYTLSATLSNGKTYAKNNLN